MHKRSDASSGCNLHNAIGETRDAPIRWQGMGQDSSEAATDHEAHVIIERGSGVKRVNAAIARNVAHVAVMAEKAGGIAPGSNRVALAVEAGLRAERGVFSELLGAVVGVDQEHEVVVSDVAAGGVPGLERDAGAVAKAGDDRPAGLLLEGGGARRRDDLGVDGGAGVCDVAGVVARRGGPQRDRGTNGDGRAAGHRRGGIFGGYDVGLHRGIRGIGGIAGGHDALVKRALSAVAIVAANTEKDGALFVHWVVASRAYAAVVCRNRAGRSVAPADRPLIWLPLEEWSDDSVGDGRVGSVFLWVEAREQAVLNISHDPRAVAGAKAPNGAGAKVDGLHVAITRIAIARLGVAVVEAAGIIVVSPVEDRVRALRPVAYSCAAGGVVAVASAGRDEDTVRLLTVQRDRCANRAGQVIVAIRFRTVEAAGRSLGKVITAAGLVVNDGDEAGRAGAEGVLGSGISNTTGGQRRDVGCGTVGATFHLVE